MPSIAAAPASSCRYWRNAVTKPCWRSEFATAAPNGIELGRHARLARLHLDHVQAEAAVHEPRQHADLGPAEDLARELRRAVVRGQRAQVTPFRPAGAVGQRARRAGEAVARLAVVATHVEQRGLGALAQRDDVHARCHRKQDVANACAFACRELARMRRVVPAARLGGRFGDVERALEQRVDRRRRGFADRAVGSRRVIGSKEALALRRLSQQFGAGALAQCPRCDGLARRVQRHAVDAGNCEGVGGCGHDRGLLKRRRRGAPAGCGRRARSGAGCARPGTGAADRPATRTRSTHARGG